MQPTSLFCGYWDSLKKSLETASSWTGALCWLSIKHMGNALLYCMGVCILQVCFMVLNGSRDDIFKSQDVHGRTHHCDKPREAILILWLSGESAGQFRWDICCQTSPIHLKRCVFWQSVYILALPSEWEEWLHDLKRGRSSKKWKLCNNNTAGTGWNSSACVTEAMK